jgi:NADH-quinone oxidoreductase subunit C
MTASDEGDSPRFEVIFQLFSHSKKARIRVKIRLEDGESMPTCISLWPGCNWAEREIWDMFGISFDGHPDLRRIVMDQRWEGHPLRKDYPLRGYQIFLTPEPIDPKLLED